MNVFINLAIRDVTRSRQFFSALGFTFNEQFCTDDTLGMRLSDKAMVMLLQHDKFATFLNGRARVDTGKALETLNAIQADSRAEVDSFMDNAIAAGGAEFRPAEDHGFMYGRSFTDLDGHVWEPFWFDSAKMPS
jgi:hypothetical protein